MTPPPESVHVTASIAEVIGRLAASRHGALPVHDDGGAHLGAVVTGDREAIDRAPRDARASDTLTALPTLSPDQALPEALIRLSAYETTGLPVVDGRDGVLLGWLNQRDVLAAYAGATDPGGVP
jgi:CBS domain-containing protein